MMEPDLVRHVYQLLVESVDGRKAPIGTAFSAEDPEHLFTAAHNLPKKQGKTRSRLWAERLTDHGRTRETIEIVEVRRNEGWDVAHLTKVGFKRTYCDSLMPGPGRLPARSKVIVIGYPITAGVDRHIELETQIQRIYREGERDVYELETAMPKGMSGSPLLWIGESASVVGMIVERTEFGTKTGLDTPSTTSYTKAVALGGQQGGMYVATPWTELCKGMSPRKIRNLVRENTKRGRIKRTPSAVAGRN